MPRCFVIQPFDKGPFDKRYDGVFTPAIRKAGLEPYRVDRDPRVDIPIETIESEIRDSALCLADITTDNPNVWYELGYAHANGKDVVLVCSSERARFPFDIQHRSVIQYDSASPQDFNKLSSAISARLKALMERQQNLQTVSSLSPLIDTEGLSSHEVVALVSIMERSKTRHGRTYISEVLEDMQNAGYTDIAVSLSVESLARKHMINLDVTELGFDVCNITEKGISWLIDNQGKFKLTST